MRKRSNYRPRQVDSNPLKRVLTGLLPMATAKNEVMVYTIQNHSALAALADGTGTTQDVYTIGHAFITAQSLAVGGLGTDWVQELNAAQEAWQKVSKRYNTWGKLEILAAELQAMSTGMEVFDVQLEVCTIQQFELAVQRAKHAIRSKSSLVKRICHTGHTQSITGK